MKFVLGHARSLPVGPRIHSRNAPIRDDAAKRFQVRALRDATLNENAVMSEKFGLTVVRHGAFGALATLRLPGQPDRRFTRQEASILARALAAVAQGESVERTIYMSPIAADHDFEARVAPDGVAIAAAGVGDLRLDWSTTRALAEALASFAERFVG